MAKVVYRGVNYDTQERRDELKAKQQTRWFNEIYRGINTKSPLQSQELDDATNHRTQFFGNGSIYWTYLR